MLLANAPRRSGLALRHEERMNQDEERMRQHDERIHTSEEEIRTMHLRFANRAARVRELIRAANRVLAKSLRLDSAS